MCAEQHAFRPSAPGSDVASGRADDGALGRALSLVRYLRARCPWDARQTPETLRPYLLEEAHEVAEAIRVGSDADLAGELGDLLLNLAFQIVLAEERRAFGPADVVNALEAKMRRRHPHVYGSAEEPPDWEALKVEERQLVAEDSSRHAGAERDPAPRDPGASGSLSSDPFEGVPGGLDSLSRAARYQERAAGLNFDWPSPRGALEKLREEADELERLLSAAPDGRDASPEVGEEIGDLLFAAVNVARLAGIHPAVALDAALEKFAARFRRVLALAREAGLEPRAASLEALDALWERSKAEERRRDGRPPATAVSPRSGA